MTNHPSKTDALDNVDDMHAAFYKARRDSISLVAKVVFIIGYTLVVFTLGHIAGAATFNFIG